MKKLMCFSLVFVYLITGCNKSKVRFSQKPEAASDFNFDSDFDAFRKFQAIKQLPVNCSGAYPLRVVFSKASDGSYKLRTCTQLKWQSSTNIYAPAGTLTCTGSLVGSTGATSFSFNDTKCGGFINMGSNGEVNFNYTCTGFHNRMIGQYQIFRDTKDTSKIINIGLLGTACGSGQDLPPKITNPGNQSNKEGNSVSIQVTAKDPEGSPIAFSATGLPKGLSISSTSGKITGNVTSGTKAGSPYNTTLKASDGNNTSSTTITWNISASTNKLPPNVTNPGTKTNNNGAVVSLQIQASSPQGSALNYSASGLPTGLSIAVKSGLISGTIGSNASASSPYSTTITVKDTVASISTSVNFVWNVKAATSSSFVKLAWTANTEKDLAGYKVYHSEVSGNFSTGAPVTLGKVIAYTWNNVTRGKTHYFAITAYDNAGNESKMSAQVSKFIP
ncbi:MAG: Ig domain-containing protein [Pseudomonadota bacterium]|nr:Ig domain-containing protein [Pseudomonadota bacterium]